MAEAGAPIELEIRVLPGRRPISGPIETSDTDPFLAPVPGSATGALGLGGTDVARRFRVLAGDRVVDEFSVPLGDTIDFQVVRSQVTLASGERLVIEALDRIAIQSVTGYVPDEAHRRMADRHRHPGRRRVGTSAVMRALRHP